jgi:hypothetical protein
VEGPRRRVVPGDITLTPVHGGYLIGRVLPARGPGPWWEYVKVVADRADAVNEALRLARPGRHRLWFQPGSDLSEAFPIDFGGDLE